MGPKTGVRVKKPRNRRSRSTLQAGLLGRRKDETIDDPTAQSIRKHGAGQEKRGWNRKELNLGRCSFRKEGRMEEKWGLTDLMCGVHGEEQRKSNLFTGKNDQVKRRREGGRKGTGVIGWWRGIVKIR